MANYVHYQEFFKSYLGGWSFEDGDKTLTIKSVGEEEVYNPKSGEKKKALCATFEEEKLPMVLNATNCETIAAVIGTDRMPDWIGHKIIVGATEGVFFGKKSKVIRVRRQKPDEKTYVCEDCGQVIKSALGKQPSELAEIATRNCGKVLCVACMKKYKNERESKK